MRYINITKLLYISVLLAVRGVEAVSTMDPKCELKLCLSIFSTLALMACFFELVGDALSTSQHCFFCNSPLSPPDKPAYNSPLSPPGKFTLNSPTAVTKGY